MKQLTATVLIIVAFVLGFVVSPLLMPKQIAPIVSNNPTVNSKPFDVDAYINGLPKEIERDQSILKDPTAFKTEIEKLKPTTSPDNNLGAMATRGGAICTTNKWGDNLLYSWHSDHWALIYVTSYFSCAYMVQLYNS